MHLLVLLVEMSPRRASQGGNYLVTEKCDIYKSTRFKHATALLDLSSFNPTFHVDVSHSLHYLAFDVPPSLSVP